MIKVSGTMKMRINFSVDLDMTTYEFDSISDRKQKYLLDTHIDWFDACRNGEVDDFEIDDVIEESE